MEWTGATWVLTEGKYAGQRVTITGLYEDETWGIVWKGQLSGGDRIIFVADTLDREMDPKTRKPWPKWGCS